MPEDIAIISSKFGFDWYTHRVSYHHDEEKNADGQTNDFSSLYSRLDYIEACIRATVVAYVP